MEKSWQSVYSARTAEASENLKLRCDDEIKSGIEERCESEIEKLLLVEMAFSRLWGQPPNTVSDPTFPWSEWGQLDYPANGVAIIPQAEIGAYRVDFLLVVGTFDGVLRLVVVECDGHDFHERTKAQAQHDKKRDRDLQKLGLPVLRFTGSEVWRDAKKCVADITAHIRASVDSARAERQRTRDE